MNKVTRGARGELAAARFLRDKGYEILSANYTSRQGEIDIIASDGEYIAFVEVKTRAANAMVQGRDSVTRQKQSKIITTAMLYLSQSGLELQPRFDVIEVIVKDTSGFEIVAINHLKNAFGGESENAYI